MNNDSRPFLNYEGQEDGHQGGDDRDDNKYDNRGDNNPDNRSTRGLITFQSTAHHDLKDINR